MQNLSRHSKKIVSMMMIAVMVLTICVCSFSFESYAANTYYALFSEPSFSDEQGYIAIEYQRNDGSLGFDVFYWALNVSLADGSVGSCQMDLYVQNNVIRFAPQCFNATLSMWVLSSYSDDGTLKVRRNATTFESYEYTAYRDVGYNIKAFYYKGNVGYVNTSLAAPIQGGFTIVFNAHENAIKLQALYEQMLISNANDSTIINKLDSIMNSNASIDTKLSQLIELQEEENTWLQKIWTSIQRFFKGDNVEDDTKVEEFNSTSKEQSETLNELNEQNKTDKIDVDSTSNEIDTNIDTEAIENYGTVLSVFTNNTHIFQYILIVLAVALIAYVLFGKR